MPEHRAMRRSVAAFIVLLVLLTSASPGAEYDRRWVYVSRGLCNPADVADIQQIVRTSSAHGLNGMVLSAGLDRLDRQPPEYFEGLETIKKTCREEGIEIIPIINPRDWLEALDKTPGAEGIMYTTWRNKYGLLGPFGDLVSGNR